MSVATVLAGNELKNLIGKLEVDDLLEPIGLARRRTHLGESLVFMGAGIAIGGAAAVLIASSRKKDVISWLSEKVKASVEVAEEAGAGAEETVASVKEEVQVPPKTDNNHHQAGAVDAAV